MTVLLHSKFCFSAPSEQKGTPKDFSEGSHTIFFACSEKNVRPNFLVAASRNRHNKRCCNFPKYLFKRCGAVTAQQLSETLASRTVVAHKHAPIASNERHLLQNIWHLRCKFRLTCGTRTHSSQRGDTRGIGSGKRENNYQVRLLKQRAVVCASGLLLPRNTTSRCTCINM